MTNQAALNGNAIDALVAAAQATHQPQLMELPPLDLSKAQILLHPEGMQITNLADHMDRFRLVPVRRKGTSQALDLDALIRITNRFKDANSVVFADPNIDKPSLTAIFNYNPEGGDSKDSARFGDHRCIYRFPYSKQWNIWKGSDATVMKQAEFAAFVEDNVADVLMPSETLLGDIKARATGGDFGERTADEELAYLISLHGGELATPNKLLELSRGLTAFENMKVTDARSLQSGETQIQFASEHKDEAGGKLKVPNFFLIAIPVFLNGPLYRIAVRLRYRLTPNVVWFYQMYRLDKVLDHVFTEACTRVMELTELPLYRGHPES